MKVCVITLHRVFNYGSVLQAYASQKVIEKTGVNVEVIDYISPQRTNKRLFFQVPKGYKKANRVKICAYIMARMPSILQKKKTFGGFIKRNIRLTHHKYITPEAIRQTPPEADVYVSGSDQVWNSQYNEGIDDAYFLGFVPQEKRKISFASSFGKNSLEEFELERTGEYLSTYHRLSVREDVAVKICEDLGLDAVCIIDPTLQLSCDEWLKIASDRIIKEPYVLLMTLYSEDNGATDYARKIADDRGIKVVKLCWDIRKPSKVDIILTHRKPEDFLSLFAYADFIVTNSFHGLAFCINLHKQFIVVPRKEFNTRIESLLRLTGLEKRLVSDIEQCDICHQAIDYDPIEVVLDNERKKAMDFLVEALK